VHVLHVTLCAEIRDHI